jgi:5-methyltetrahydropteroyltriglutamate--homocysteine methyltransferase
MSPRTKPPFRADEVGSLLRSQAIKEAREKREQSKITAAELKSVEDREIPKIIAKQEEAGLKLATDGEYRRSWWHLDFFWGLTGCEKLILPHGIKFHGVETKPEGMRITGKLDFPADHPMLDHFRFLKAHTKVTPKMCIPAPPVLHFRLPKDGIPKSVYPDMDGFFHDLGQTWKKAVRAFYDAGCRYLQFDDTVWAYLCSAEEMKAARERMPWVDELPRIYQEVINTALAAKPADMTITTHVCRGNFRSTWVTEGGYEPVAERLLGGLAYDGYFLEYDTDRAGGFEPLRFLPKGNKAVVLGLVTSKSGTLEGKDAIKRRLDEASRFVALEQCCLSPQCGFASTEEGNVLTEEQQWAKLRMIVELATEVWG